MITEDQKGVTDFLRQAAGGARCCEIETHISRIFLAPDRVFKLKRAVALPYVDFSTAEKRLAACEKEVALNSRTAPGLYRGVEPIVRTADGSLGFGGAGELVDAVVVMRRFEQSALMDAMAEAGQLTMDHVDEVARTIAAFHRDAPVVPGEGGSANIAAVLDINERAFATSRIFDRDEVARLNALFREHLARHAGHLDARASAGKIRRCHGDLHLRNICWLDGAPRLFDCIEFNDRIATTDVLYDLAFLLMDLWHRDLRAHANLVANRYFDLTGEADGFGLLSFLMAIRAAVRAHVTATAGEERDGDRTVLEEMALSYFDLSMDLLKPCPSLLLAVGGFSGSGKSTVSAQLADQVGPAPGARILESDTIRKGMHGVSRDTTLPPDAYRPEVSEQVYGQIFAHSQATLAEGAAVLANAVFDLPTMRAGIAESAAAAGVPCCGVWLDVVPQRLRERVGARSGGSSDATVDVLERQLERGAGDNDWVRIDADRPVDKVVRAIVALANSISHAHDEPASSTGVEHP
ncbi:AAA family ATPase [Rhizobium sp. NRK18]|uniref:bifunctional aminoglycoside phosphotransferase/ATP-binding protein n=1 Tax=Rhizobium sp. NRK18 TaxID=2964667 RepID=UPI0021C2E262|nr:bifunctional aminoglycoside phosphotransferase/ATP-binding protein [Rhizobium sp. NRK18]MCQ2004127.1 AAA family ATPase [Rhizobium sp. NRK18]